MHILLIAPFLITLIFHYSNHKKAYLFVIFLQLVSCFSQFLVGNYSEYITFKTVFTSLNFYSFEKNNGN